MAYASIKPHMKYALVLKYQPNTDTQQVRQTYSIENIHAK